MASSHYLLYYPILYSSSIKQIIYILPLFYAQNHQFFIVKTSLLLDVSYKGLPRFKLFITSYLVYQFTLRSTSIWKGFKEVKKSLLILSTLKRYHTTVVDIIINYDSEIIVLITWDRFTSYAPVTFSCNIFQSSRECDFQNFELSYRVEEISH